jgi:hypothetical protein
VPFVGKTRMRVHRENEDVCPRPLRERTDRAQRDQVRARESRRFRRPSPGAPLRGTPPSPAWGEGGSERRASRSPVFLQSRTTDWRKENHHAERPSLDSVAAPAAGGGGAASQGRFHGDPQALRRGRTIVGKLPARCVPPSSLLRRRHPRLPRAQLAAAVGASTRGGPHRGPQWRAAARAGAVALRMGLAPLSAVEFRPWLSGCFTLPWRGRVAHPRCAGWGARRCRQQESPWTLSPQPAALRAIADASHRRSSYERRRPEAAFCFPLQGKVGRLRCRRRRTRTLAHSRTTCGSARKFDGVTNTIRLASTMVPARK